MAGLFGLLYWAIAGGAILKDSIKNGSLNIKQEQEAIRKGKPYYYNHKGDIIWIATGERCVYWMKRNGDRCLYSTDYKREIYNFDAERRKPSVNASIERATREEKEAKKVRALCKSWGKTYHPVRYINPYIKDYEEVYIEDLSREEYKAICEFYRVCGRDYDGYDDVLYREDVGEQRYYLIHRRSNLPQYFDRKTKFFDYGENEKELNYKDHQTTVGIIYKKKITTLFNS